MFHRRVFAGIVLAACFVACGCVLIPATDAFCQDSTVRSAIEVLLQSEKLIAPEAITAPFLAGKTKARVIVTLREPAGFRRSQDLRREEERTKLSGAVRDVQNRFLPGLNTKEVHLTNRFTYLFGFSAELSLDGLRQLEAAPEVVSIEEDAILHAHLGQGIPLMNAITARSTYNGSGVAIAICDTGIDYRHPRLGGGGFPNSKVIGGYDCGDDDSNPMDAQGHGTACAGIAAGDLGTSGDYIGGVAHNAKLYAVKIAFGTSGTAFTSDMIEGWEWCITHQNDDPNNPIMIISTSFGGSKYSGYCDGDSPGMTTAAANATAAGITIFVSSGNDGYCGAMGWPACISHVISVGAVYDADFGLYTPCVSIDSCANKLPTSGCSSGWYVIDDTTGDMVTSYSNSASFLGVFAPSNAAYTTDILAAGGYSTGDYYWAFGGTSAASPYAAGAAACLQSASKVLLGSFLSASEVRSTLYDTGDLITDAKIPSVVRPRINLGNAVNSIIGTAPASIDYPAVDCDGEFTVSWDAATGATNYTLERAQNESFSDAQEVYSGASTSYDESGLSEGTYWYRVRAVVDGVNSAWTAGGSLTVSSPQAPSTLTVPSGDCDGSFLVTWSSVAGAESYTVERATDASFSDASEVYSGASTSHNESGLDDGAYYYRVKAGSSCGDSDWTTAGPVEVGIPSAMPESILYPSESCEGAFTVTWSSAAEATGYVLERAEEESFSVATQVYSGAATTYDENGLGVGVYYYRVRAQDSCGPGEWRDGPAVQVTGVGTISLDQTVNGSWADTCYSRNRISSYGQYYAFSLSVATQVQIDLMSTADTVMFLLQGAGMDGSVITYDDDGGDGLNSRIITWLNPGSYTIEATTWWSFVAADFTLSLTKLCTTPNVLSFNASPKVIWKLGGKSVLSWSIAGADTAWINPGGIQVNPTSGTLDVFPTTTTDYTLQASSCGQSDEASVRVKVSIGANPMPWNYFLLYSPTAP
ncbi:MAG: S8 family serine peptidase [Deltaproteobacteria bacterium]|nr:S8 family serine peptidase [Deltaproteobacteria bacterium]